MASHVLCDYEALAALRFRYLGQHFLKPGDFDDISISRVLYFVPSLGLLKASAKGLHERLKTVKVHR